MYIQTVKPGFIPSNFSIYKFYGNDTCFAWKENQLVVFPYSEDESQSTLPLHVITVPGVIKCIQNFEDRVFIICTPCGIYKLTEKLQFANLSKRGIGIGCHFSKVFTFYEECINLEDKQDKSIKKLCHVSNEIVTSDKFSSIKLIAEESDENFRTAFLEENRQGDVCLISYNKFLYKLTQNVIKLIYNCDYIIQEILPIEKKGIICGVVLLTNYTAVIFVYLEDKELRYDKIYLNYDGRNIKAFCAKIDENSEYISFIYSTHSKTYQCRKKFNLKTVQNVKEENRSYVALRFYKSDFAIGLNSFNELCRIRLKEMIETNTEDSDFVDLKLHMMEGTEVIVDKICEKAKELQIINEWLAEETDILKRINMYAYETREKYCPELRIEKLAGKKYLAAKFQEVFPMNSQIILAADCGNQRTFCIKKVTDSVTQINLPLMTQNTSKRVDVTIDLITYNPKGESVCLIKDFIKDPDTIKQSNLSPQKDNFVNLKIRALKNLITEGKVTMQALSEIKSNIRRELRNVD